MGVARITGIDIGIYPKPFITTSEGQKFPLPDVANWNKEYEAYAHILWNEYDVIGIETLYEDSSPWIHSIGYPMFKQKLYDVRSAYRNRVIFQVAWNFPSTKMCSICGGRNKTVKQYDKEWICPGCGVTHDRDLNAAVNLRDRAAAKYTEWYTKRHWHSKQYGWQLREAGNFGKSKPPTYPDPLFY